MVMYCLWKLTKVYCLFVCLLTGERGESVLGETDSWEIKVKRTCVPAPRNSVEECFLHDWDQHGPSTDSQQPWTGYNEVVWEWPSLSNHQIGEKKKETSDASFRRQWQPRQDASCTPATLSDWNCIFYN